MYTWYGILVLILCLYLNAYVWFQRKCKWLVLCFLIEINHALVRGPVELIRGLRHDVVRRVARRTGSGKRGDVVSASGRLVDVSVADCTVIHRSTSVKQLIIHADYDDTTAPPSAAAAIA